MELRYLKYYMVTSSVKISMISKHFIISTESMSYELLDSTVYTFSLISLYYSKMFGTKFLPFGGFDTSVLNIQPITT